MKKVRKATFDDIPRILELLVQVDMVHHNGRPDIFKGPTTKYDSTELGVIIQNEETPVFVCVDEDGKILGHMFCIFRQETDNRVLTDVKTLYIDDICVNEKARGLGVGSELFNYIKKYAKENGFYNITLNVWCCNPDAMKFYEAMGMEAQKIGMEMIL